MILKVSTVIFDMDGVITDTMPYHFQVWQDLFVREGVPVTHEDIYKREGQKGIDSVREIFAEYGKPFSEEHALRLLKEKEELFQKVFKRHFIPGAIDFIRELHTQGFKLALVTGTSRTEAMKLLPADLFELFNASVCGNEVKNGKPDPEPYLTALQKLSIEGADAVVIENAPFGIRSAKAAGIKCLALETSLPKPYLTQADGIFESFGDLKLHVKFENSVQV
jgi:beta-phosphoglucomutase